MTNYTLELEFTLRSKAGHLKKYMSFFFLYSLINYLLVSFVPFFLLIYSIFLID